MADQQQRRSIGTSWHRQPAAAAIRRCNKMQQNLAAAQSMECYLLTQSFLVSWEIDKRGFIVRNTTNHSTFNGRSNATDKTQYTKETKDRGGWEGGWCEGGVGKSVYLVTGYKDLHLLSFLDALASPIIVHCSLLQISRDSPKDTFLGIPQSHSYLKFTLEFTQEITQICPQLCHSV